MFDRKLPGSEEAALSVEPDLEYSNYTPNTHLDWDPGVWSKPLGHQLEG